MADARRRYSEQHRWAAFERSSRDWRTATEHRAFLAVARAAAERHGGPERDELLAQLDFAEGVLAALDPLGDIRAMAPAAIAPGPEDLKPFSPWLEPIRTWFVGLVAGQGDAAEGRTPPITGIRSPGR